MNILLWERNLNTVFIKCVIDGIENVTDDIRLFRSVCPYKHLQVDA